MGIIKKADFLLAVIVAIVADWIVQTAAGKIGVDFDGFFFFGLLVTIWLILNECISILENVSEIGFPIPAFLLRIVQKLKKTVEEVIDEENPIYKDLKDVPDYWKQQAAVMVVRHVPHR